MKSLMSLLAVLAAVVGVRAADAPGLVNGHPPDIRTLKSGDTAPDFELLGTDGKKHKLAEYTGGEALVVLFTSNHCPTSHSIERRLQKFYEEYKGKGVKLLAINPNHPDGLSKDELGYGEYGDSYAEMKPYAEKNKWTFDYLYDGDTQTIARAYGCLATPHVFVFDKNLKLRYQGRFDDSRFYDDSTVKSKDCQNAVDAILAGKPVALELTKPMGCSTKWREKKALHDAKHETWAKTPVTVELIDKAGIADLRANKSNKYRMINVWATWCPPCVREMPVLQKAQADLPNVHFVFLNQGETAYTLAQAPAEFLSHQQHQQSTDRCVSVRQQISSQKLALRRGMHFPLCLKQLQHLRDYWQLCLSEPFVLPLNDRQHQRYF